MYRYKQLRIRPRNSSWEIIMCYRCDFWTPSSAEQRPVKSISEVSSYEQLIIFINLSSTRPLKFMGIKKCKSALTQARRPSSPNFRMGRQTALLLKSVLSVCLSVQHTPDPRLNGLRYRSASCAYDKAMFSVSWGQIFVVMSLVVYPKQVC